MWFAYPEIFKRLDFRTSSPIFIILRPMTSVTYGRRVSITAAGPAIENISLPAAATFLSPKTGDATKEAPSSRSLSAADAHVSGCTVDVSTNILFFNEQFADRTFVNSSFKTASFDIYTSNKTSC